MRPVLRWTALALSLAGAGVACGRGHGGGGAPGDDGGDAVEGGTGDDAPVFPGDDGATAEAAPGEGGLAGDGSTVTDCAAGAELVYLVSEERELFSFDPGKNVIAPIGSVDCASGAYANSMAIDRSATAWINYADGSLWRASTKTGACTATGFVPNQQGVGLFGMGFSAKAAGGSDEQLFIDDLAGNGLGYIDLAKMQ
ncbi:MAG: hypothetical protein ACRELB_10445, partial [Polyangiaceae bacterium]